MRTHRLKITCNSEQAARFYEENVVHQYFVDLTHWFCGLDGAGEDTPDECLIYRGIIEPNVIYAEFNAKAIFDGDIETNASIVKNKFKVGKFGDNEEVLDVNMGHLDHYDKILELSEDGQH